MHRYLCLHPAILAVYDLAIAHIQYLGLLSGLSTGTPLNGTQHDSVYIGDRKNFVEKFYSTYWYRLIIYGK